MGKMMRGWKMGSGNGVENGEGYKIKYEGNLKGNILYLIILISGIIKVISGSN